VTLIHRGQRFIELHAIVVKSENTMRSKKWYVYVAEGDTGAPIASPRSRQPRR
jgi:hypothetical protein